LFAANILFALALLFSYLASFVNPEIFALPSLFGLAYPFLLLINFLFVVLWASTLNWEVVISIVAILIGLTHFSNFIQFNRTGPSTEGAFRVMSYNVRLFNNYEKNPQYSEDVILSFLKEEGADILCLQEVFANEDNSTGERYLKNELGNGYYSHTKFIGKSPKRRYGIATYSKYKIVNRGEVFHPNSSSLTIFTDIVIGKDTVRIFNNHLQSFKLKNVERSFIDEIISSDERETIDGVKQLSVNLRKAFIQRANQAILVKQEINKSPYPVIVLGDFNDTPISFAYRKLRKGLNDSFVESGYGAGFTYKGGYPANRIDYVLYNDELESKYFEIKKVKYSDHYPVCSYLMIK